METTSPAQKANALNNRDNKISNGAGQFPIISAWPPILVITDNRTRHCLGVSLFIAGAKVTAEAIVDALLQLLPLELQFFKSRTAVSSQGL